MAHVLSPDTILAKTPTGQDEIQNRTLRLPLLLRRVLLLVDGQRSARDLATFVPGQDVAPMLDELLDKGCVAVHSAPAAAAPAATSEAAAAATSAETAGAPVSPELARLPAAHLRTPKEVEMARNFMINTINTMLEQNSRLTLVKQIFDSPGPTELRRLYPEWEAAIGGSWIGGKRLPELRKKLFAVL